MFPFQAPEPSVPQALIPLAFAAIVAIAVPLIYFRWRDRQRRLELLHEALRNPNLLPDVQRELVRALRPPRARLPFVAGWFGLFGGIGWLCTDPRGDAFSAAVVVTVAAFALVTLPLALRELDARRA